MRAFIIIALMFCSLVNNAQECGTVFSESRYEGLKNFLENVDYKKYAKQRSSVVIPVTLWSDWGSHTKNEQQIKDYISSENLLLEQAGITLVSWEGSVRSISTYGDIGVINGNSEKYTKNMAIFKSGSFVEGTLNIYFYGYLADVGLMFEYESSNVTQAQFGDIIAINPDKGYLTSILAHEVGHYLGLFHTFGKGDHIKGKVLKNSDVLVRDDFVNDTPFDPGNNERVISTCEYKCSNISSHPCAFYPGTLIPYSPDLTNIMAYHNDICPTTFSADQKAIMNVFATQNRSFYTPPTSCVSDPYEPSYPELPSDVLYSNENTFDKTVYAKYDNSYDIDSYKFRLKKDGKLKITMRLTPIPTRVYITTQSNPNAELFSYNVNAGSYVEEFETGDLIKNVNYLIHVEPRNIPVPCGTYYYLTIANQSSAASTCTDNSESNNTQNQAYYMGDLDGVGGNRWRTAYIGSATDIDYYSFKMNKAGKYRITLSDLPLDYDFSYIDANGSTYIDHQR
ncbi:MAG: hypothetical protein RLZZ546_779, partial [Bacteroidota bacterium]